MFENIKITESLILGLAAGALTLAGKFATEFFSIFQNKLSRGIEADKLEVEKGKNYQQEVMQILTFLEGRNEFLSKEIERVRTEKDSMLVELYKVREDKLRLEIRSEFRMQMVRDGEHEVEAYDKVTEMEAFSLNDADAILISDDNKNIFGASKPALDFFGYSSVAEIKHRSIDELLPGMHAITYKAGTKGKAMLTFRGQTKAGIVGKEVSVVAVHRTGIRIPVRMALKTWTDGSMIFYASVLNLKEPAPVDTTPTLADQISGTDSPE